MISPINLVKAIQTPYMLMALALLVLGAYGAGFVKGIQSEGEKHVQYRIAVETAMAELEAKAAAARRDAERISQDTADGYRAAADYWRSHPRIVRVRNDNCGAGAVPAVSVTASGLDGRAAEPGLGARPDVAIAVAECEDRLNNAVMDAAQLIWIQDWIKQQHEVSK